MTLPILPLWKIPPLQWEESEGEKPEGSVVEVGF